MMNRFMPWLMVSLLIGLITAGCSAPAQPTTPTVERVSAASPDDLAILWEATGDTLRAHYWRLDRQDRQEGIVTTFPETTANWFEWWRPQSPSPFYWWEANIHTTQRQATVWIKRAVAGAYDIQVQVDRYRYSLPERQVTNSAEAMRLYSSGSPTYGGRAERPSQTSHWIPVGRDATLESQVLRQIVQEYERIGPASQPSF